MARDILIDETGDLVFKDGDLKVGNSDEQCAILIINTVQGAWKQFPTAGVGIILYSASSGQSGTLRNVINTQMERDGFRDILVELTEDGNDSYSYNINATRTDGI